MYIVVFMGLVMRRRNLALAAFASNTRSCPYLLIVPMYVVKVAPVLHFIISFVVAAWIGTIGRPFFCKMILYMMFEVIRALPWHHPTRGRLALIPHTVNTITRANNRVPIRHDFIMLSGHGLEMSSAMCFVLRAIPIVVDETPFPAINQPRWG
jgi:hypothetical protein